MTVRHECEGLRLSVPLDDIIAPDLELNREKIVTEKRGG
jgi:hypothetical protein